MRLLKVSILDTHAIVNLWKRIARRASLPEREPYVWNSFRRAFANALRDVALRDLVDVGGWKSARRVSRSISKARRPHSSAHSRHWRPLPQVQPPPKRMNRHTELAHKADDH